MTDRHAMTAPPESRVIRIEPDTPKRLGDRPDTAQLKGTHFDESLSQAMGFKSYPVGGNVGYVGRVVAQSWGRPWIEQGWIDIEFRRPLYGDTDVALDFSALREEDGSLVSHYTLTYDDAVCWRGRVGIPLGTAALPDVAEFPVTPGTMPGFEEAPDLVGQNLPTRDLRFDGSVFDVARGGDLDSIDPPVSWYANCYKRVAKDILALEDAQPWLWDARIVVPWQVFPGLLDTTGAHFTMQVSASFRFFGPVPMDEDLQFRSRLLDAYERKGSRFAIHDHLLVAGDRPLMLNRWDVLYDFAKARHSGGEARV